MNYGWISSGTMTWIHILNLNIHCSHHYCPHSSIFHIKINLTDTLIEIFCDFSNWNIFHVTILWIYQSKWLLFFYSTDFSRSHPILFWFLDIWRFPNSVYEFFKQVCLYIFRAAPFKSYQFTWTSLNPSIIFQWSLSLISLGCVKAVYPIPQ